ncbi:uncharacterized protein LOC126381675 [Pectinophora gossypiella]|uniref:uncharacterized protein LOC126380942 n=1 Tax=Pectinophora gossypiella TaxID=13191 RepID=UPI00214F505E|nr:uncharacterized protein LOC126380942 [Pectinophora gossypiella]XP_049886641.1 uncharacterized protein LOC126381160 [Pectinophora gossypiella]XP_049886699.1 uncharacterized protein LOC126381240 [Pectinophora gossypiella]XP_049886925.1 uncharacterized protein LOC126381482 [Pectinophora gossypiella]XP_049887087.1 uncharacterized protein LOC126381675 [Pectinophora gossypiella]
MLRIEASNENSQWSESLWRLQLTLNCTKHKTTQTSPLQLLVGIEGATPIIRSVIRDIAIEDTHPNREAIRELQRQRASDLLEQNRQTQDLRVNSGRKITRSFNVNDMVFVNKHSQMTGKLDSGMRGPYRVTKVLPHGRYELRLLGNSYGKTTQAAVEHMVAWRGEWTPESCASFFETMDNEDDQPTQPHAGPSMEHVVQIEHQPSRVGEDAHVSGEAVLEESGHTEGDMTASL